MFEELGMRGGTFIILCVLGYFIIKWAVKNGVGEAVKKLEGNTETDQLSTVLLNTVGKRCSIYTSSPVTFELGKDLDKLWKLECEILEVDHCFIRVQYEENKQIIEKIIRLNQLKSVEIKS